MPKQRSVHAGGYSLAGAARLQRVELPERIKCAVCKKAKAVNFFSTIQQNVLKNAIAIGKVRDAAVEATVSCVACTPKQVTELECCICGEVKGLDGFAKGQRRLGEEARCITCVAELSGEMPIETTYTQHLLEVLGEPSDDDDDDDDDGDDDDAVSNAYESSTYSGGTTSNAGVPLASNYDLNDENPQSLNLSSDGQSSKPSASQAATSAPVTNTRRVRGVAAPAATSAWQAFTKRNDLESTQSTSGAEFTGYDPQGKAHRIVRPTSTVPTDGYDDDIIPDPREQARKARQERDANSRFARLPGGRAAPVIIPSYVGGKTVPGPKADYDNDGDEDDDWGTI